MGIDRTDTGAGVVDGTSGNDTIDGAYTSDPQCDVIDGGDAVLAGENLDDDIVNAGNSDDVVAAGEGDDLLTGDRDITDIIAAREVFRWSEAPDPDGDDGTPGIDNRDALTTFT